MPKDQKTPIAFFAYNRPDHAERALQALSKCARLQECELFLFADGPKNEAGREKVEATRVVLRHWADRLNAHLLERAENIGLAKSIGGSVTDLCENFGRAIVVEDDLVVGTDFIDFMLTSLDRYEDEQSVFQVAGFTLAPPPDLSTSAFILPVTTTWGWATWKRAWNNFRWEPQDLAATRSNPEWRALFDINGAGAFSSMLEDRLAGRNDSWGILWWYAVSRLRGLVIYPARTLVINGGFDGSGVHSGGDDFLKQSHILPQLPRDQAGQISFPKETILVGAHLTRLEQFLNGLSASPAEPSAQGKTSAIRRALSAAKDRVRRAFR